MPTLRKICDNPVDCTVGDDETRCGVVLSSSASCPCETFYCLDDARCLGMDSVCDGLQDCSDFSEKSTFACDLKENRSISQVHITPDWDDIVATRSPVHPFPCPGRNTCLPIEAICNGLIDCYNGYDEGAFMSKVVKYQSIRAFLRHTSANFSIHTYKTTNTHVNLERNSKVPNYYET